VPRPLVGLGTSLKEYKNIALVSVGFNLLNFLKNRGGEKKVMVVSMKKSAQIRQVGLVDFLFFSFLFKIVE